MQLLGFSAMEADEIHGAGIVVNSIGAFSFTEFILTVPVDVFIGGFKNKVAPPVENFQIDVKDVFIRGAIFILQFLGSS